MVWLDPLACEVCGRTDFGIGICPSCERLVCRRCYNQSDPDPRCLGCLEDSANESHYDVYGDDDD